MKHPTNISFGALRLLRAYLAIPGVCSGIKEIYLGGKLLATLPPADIPKELDGKPLIDPAVKALFAQPQAFELEDAERDLCKKIITDLAEKKVQGAMISAAAENNELILSLGLVEK
jgi:hypothetical protein